MCAPDKTPFAPLYLRACTFFYCFPVERSLKVLLLGAVPLFVLQSKTQVGETHLSLSLSNRLCGARRAAARWKYNGAVLWPEMCDKLRKNCMPVIVILTLSCRGHVVLVLLLKSCLPNPAPAV